MDSCTPAGGDFLTLIVDQISLITDTNYEQPITDLLATFEAALSTAVTVEDFYDYGTNTAGGTMYTFEGGQTIYYETNGDVFATAEAEGLYGSFYVDGTWEIVMDCTTLGFDGTTFSYGSVDGCVPGGDLDGFMVELQAAIEAAAYGTGSS